MDAFDQNFNIKIKRILFKFKLKNLIIFIKIKINKVKNYSDEIMSFISLKSF